MLNFRLNIYFFSILAATVFLAVDVTTGTIIHDPSPAVDTINPNLLTDADAIIRFDNRRFEYRGPGNGRLFVHKMITILNSDGLSHSSVNIPYNNFVDIRRLEGAVYDKDGNRVNRIRSRDFDDESMVSINSLAEDSRTKKGSFTHTSFPFTIELEYRLDYSGFIQLPSWIPITREKTALEIAELKVIMPSSVSIDYRMFNIQDDDFLTFQSDDEIRYQWSLREVIAIERETRGPPWYELLPAVVMRSEIFNMEGYEGNMNTWAAFASWFGNLWQGRDMLTDDMKERIDLMVEDHGLTRELIREIYVHLQESTRYVSIQLGIGGFQTETAIITARNRYGDCKALSNYLLAMLRHAGFEAHPALIRNGTYSFPFDPEFVHNPFNHVVISIPFEDEIIWVEATSTTFPLGYIGSSNSNRHALVFSEFGGNLVETPLLTSDDNYQKREATVDILDDGSAIAKIYTDYGGSQHERIRRLAIQSPRVQSQNIRNMLPFNLFDIVDVEMGADPDKPVASVNLDVSIQTFSSRIGSRLMFHPNIMERNIGYLPQNENRKQPVYTGSAYHDIDEISFQIPAGYKIEALPESIELEFDYGKYSSAINPSDDGTILHYHREILFWPGVIPVEEFEIYRSFINQVVRSDNNQVVLVKN